MTATTEQRVALEQSRATALDSAACLIAAFRLLGVPGSMLDVGCGPAHLVLIAASLGVDRADGIDIQPPDIPDVGIIGLRQHDLREPLERFPLDPEKWQLVLCLEVAEHLPPESADTLCDTLVQATGGTLLFSAATPGQGGSGHLNEQTHDYWREKLTSRGLVEDEALTAELRREWAVAARDAWWYPKNLIVFRRPA